MALYVMDTSALLALFEDETGADEVERILVGSGGEAEDPPEVYLPFMALMELDYTVLREHGSRARDEAIRLIQTWKATAVESNPRWRYEAARVKASARLSLADAWIASLALLLDA